MATLVLNSDSMSVQMESDHLVITRHDNEERQTLPLVDVERVVVLGRPALTFPALVKFMDAGIPCTFMTKNGRLRGTIDTSRQHNVARRILQYDKFRDPAVRLELSRELIRSKLRNGRRVIQRLCANRSRPVADLGEHWSGLQGSLSELDGANSHEDVRGIEGFGGFHYFRLLGEFFPCAFPFVARSRRPPLDEANAVLSFAYTVLMNEMFAFVRLHALDAGLGFLHDDCERSPSLALDLMESFRPGFADMLALDLLNHCRLDKETEFERDGESGGVFLTAHSRQKVLAACETAFSRPFTAYGSGERMTLRTAMDKQVLEIVRYLETGKRVEFFRVP